MFVWAWVHLIAKLNKQMEDSVRLLLLEVKLKKANICCPEFTVFKIFTEHNGYIGHFFPLLPSEQSDQDHFQYERARPQGVEESQGL